jgi:hypothetical protein
MTTCIQIVAATTAISFSLMPSGCGRLNEWPKAASQSTERSPVVSKVSATAVTAEIDEPAQSPSSPKSGKVARIFTPPFPHRDNPFAQPDKGTVHVAARLRTSDDDDPIQLKGFITVDQPKALLRIDGRVWAAREGESRDGIAVVRILPPAVTLEREGVQWDLSLRKDG